MEERIQAVLESIGLTKNERIVYLDLIKHEKSTALEIAKRTGIHRTNTYDALRSLEEKGFISELIEEKKRTFAARKPEKILDYINQQRSEVEAVLPHFKSISSDIKEEAALTLAKGTFALREALSGLLEINKPISVTGASEEALNAFGTGFLKDFHKERIKKKIMMRHIYNEDVPERIKDLNKMKYTAARYLPKEYDTIVATAICGNTVLLFMFTNPIHVITIRNDTIADTYSKYFELFWKQARA